MGRQFNGTNQSLQSASALSLSAYDKLSLQMWFYWDAFANDDKLLLEYGAGNAGSFIIDPDGALSGSNFEFFLTDAGYTNLTVAYIGRGGVAAAAWHHLVVLFDRTQASSEVTHVYADNVDVPVNYFTNNDHTGNFGNLPLYVFNRGGSGGSLFGAGRGAELAIWGGTLLTATDVSNLWNGGAGVDARTVGSPTYYWQLCGTSSPEPALVGGINLTVTGATSVAHPISGTGICAASAAAGGSGLTAARQRRQKLLGIRGWHG